jgi:sugar O-acyltransferase (sialic acid O-acetyltransferase NeuD family)
MKDIAIYGAGGFGREVACLINRINEKNPTWNLVGFFDDNAFLKGTNNEYGEILGGVNELNDWEKEISIILAIGSPKTLKLITDKIANINVTFPNIISPDAIFLDKNNLILGKGNLICTGCLISCNVRIGDFNCLNDFVSIGHDTVIGNYNSFMTATRISGIVSIGSYNYFGVNSSVLQEIKIGNETTIAAGSAVMRRTKDGYTYIGIPASALVIK